MLEVGVAGVEQSTAVILLDCDPGMTPCVSRKGNDQDFWRQPLQVAYGVETKPGLTTAKRVERPVGRLILLLRHSAKWIVSGSSTVEPSPWLIANPTAKYTSKRFSTFDNSAGSSVPGFTVFSAHADIGDGFPLGPIKNATICVNVDNLFDKDILSFISPAITGDGLFRPLSPRTVQLSLSVDL